MCTSPARRLWPREAGELQRSGPCLNWGEHSLDLLVVFTPSFLLPILSPPHCYHTPSYGRDIYHQEECDSCSCCVISLLPVHSRPDSGFCLRTVIHMVILINPRECFCAAKIASQWTKSNWWRETKIPQNVQDFYKRVVFMCFVFSSFDRSIANLAKQHCMYGKCSVDELDKEEDLIFPHTHWEVLSTAGVFYQVFVLSRIDKEEY